jgi:indole-3-glycerol phosphate synthase
VNRTRRFSQAISEGDGISVIAAVDGPEAARRAEDAGAEALLVGGGRLGAVREASTLPVLFHLAERTSEAGADAYVVEARAAEEEERERLTELERELGMTVELAYRIEDEEQLTWVLEALDPEIVVLAIPADERGEGALDRVLDLLPDVPAGKLAIADVPVTTREEVVALERAGIDGVIVRAGDVAELVGAAPPAV